MTPKKQELQITSWRISNVGFPAKHRKEGVLTLMKKKKWTGWGKALSFQRENHCEHFQTGEDRAWRPHRTTAGRPTRLCARFPALNVSDANLAMAFPHLTARNLEVGTGNLPAVFLKPLQQRALPDGWPLRATTLLVRVRCTAQTQPPLWVLKVCASFLIL